MTIRDVNNNIGVNFYTTAGPIKPKKVFDGFHNIDMHNVKSATVKAEEHNGPFSASNTLDERVIGTLPDPNMLNKYVPTQAIAQRIDDGAQHNYSMIELLLS